MSNVQEIWKDIPGYEGLYQISNHGNVKSLPREIDNGYRKGISKEKILKPQSDKKYLRIQLSECSVFKSFAIHQLVAMAFLEHVPDGTTKTIVHHIDGNGLNNKVDNLQLISHRENMSKERTIKSGIPVGVFYDKRRNKYYSQIRVKGERLYLGYFKTPEEASAAYQNKLKEINNT